MSDKIQVRFVLGIGISNAEQVEVVEYDRDEWEAMNDDERAADLEEFANNYIDMGYEELG